MNYFGMFFSFMLPGILVGALAVAVVHQELVRKRKKAAREERARQLKNARKLYVHSFDSAPLRRAA